VLYIIELESMSMSIPREDSYFICCFSVIMEEKCYKI